ncbi:hypothetical protein [Saccharomonospora azurea]|uniref:hypothetical protein n=1 Tax=Saccharomonospora azurea TaxID=40988 RepID=UPI00240A73E6|nr:hypothetical protein [Saccharomonospora azurea]
MTAKYSQQPAPEEFVAMPPEEMRSFLESDAVPPELSDEQLRQLPPSMLESYIYAREASGDTGIFGRVSAIFSSSAQADSILEQKRQELDSQGIQYRDGLPPSDSNYLGIDHQKLKADVDPIQAEGITVFSDNYHKIHQLFSEFSDRLNSAISKSKQGWEGDAADSAHGYFGSLASWSEGNSANAEMASQILAAESDAAVRAKNSMPEPIPFNMEQEMDSWGWNPFTFQDQVDQTIQKFQESQAKHEEAAQVMTQYDFELQEAGNKQPVFAEPPKFNGASGSGDTSPSGVISINEPRTSTSGFTGGPAGSGGGSVPTGGGPVNVPSSPGGSAPPLAPGVNTGVRPPNTTRPSGWAPGGRSPNMPPPGQRNNRSQFGPGGGGIGPMPMGPGGGFGPGGPGGGGGGGRLPGGFGPGGGAGAGGAAGPGAGAASGAKPMGGPMGAGPGGGAAPGAAAAARGGGMGAPMGAGGGKGGQGGEDAEHQRPTYLVEADPDDVFGTSQRTAPPVIGA